MTNQNPILLNVKSYACGSWIKPDASAQTLFSPLNAEPLALIGSQDLDFAAMHAYARDKAGPILRSMTFHDRARILKALALYLEERKEALYELSFLTGATRADSKIDIDGGIGTLLVFASKGRKEMPDQRIYPDGDLEILSRKGSFLGQHICVPLQGVGVHINAFNFPVWGMLEKLASCFLAGVPAIIKPASATAFLAEHCFKLMLESQLLPEGSIQLISGGVGDLLDHLDCQDVVSFTGSVRTASKLRRNPNLLDKAIRFVAEQDSLNATVLGPDVLANSPDFDVCLKEIVQEMTVKAGQKCTAIRRIFAPASVFDVLQDALVSALTDLKVGDPREAETQMGALASSAQKASVEGICAQLDNEAKCVFGGGRAIHGGDAKGAYMSPRLYTCDKPLEAKLVHQLEAFGPVATLMPYTDPKQAAALLNRGGGSLVASVVTQDGKLARNMALESAAYHGRLYFNNQVSSKEATGHGAPLPHMVHGGPGRAGGGEELGGVRAVKHYMQRTAIQGTPDIISAITGAWVRGSEIKESQSHPFTRNFHDLNIGDTLFAGPREIDLNDIEAFAHFTGDTFYAHMDEDAAAANPFFPGRVAHGYLLLSFAAGMFVQPDPGPVLANTGLESLSFQKPVVPGDQISVRLTVKQKTKRTQTYGEVKWQVYLTNQNQEQVAEYVLLTMNAYE